MALDQYDREDPDPSLSQRRGGAIARLVITRGFGFIAEQPSGKEYFFHISEVENVEGIAALRDGDQVTFVPATSPKGPRATQVRVISTASQAGRRETAAPKARLRG